MLLRNPNRNESLNIDVGKERNWKKMSALSKKKKKDDDDVHNALCGCIARYRRCPGGTK